jgi:hypothetical protein
MKIDEELLEIFKKNPSKFPLGYQFISFIEVEKIEGRIGYSKNHNSTYYILTHFYKPTSIIFADDPK